MTANTVYEGNTGKTCKWCENDIYIPSGQSKAFIITGGVCSSCAEKISAKTESTVENRKYIDSIDDPILLMQPEPRLVYTANKKAAELFNKKLSEIEGFRGGQVFDCVHSFTEAGCGKDANCKNCKIKAAIVDTLITGNSFASVESPLEIKRNNKIDSYLLRISNEKTGNLALVRIDHFQQL